MAIIPSKLAGLLARLRERGVVHRAGGEWRTRCPAHADNSPSLYIALSLDGRCILLNCKSGCDPEDIVAEVDLDMSDLFLDDDEMVEVNGDFEVVDEETLIDEELECFETGSDPDAGPAGPDEGDLLEPAAPELLDKVYGGMLDRLPLSEGHRQDLRRRGLADVDSDQIGCRSLTRFALNQAVGQLKETFDDQTLLRVPGFRTKRGRVRFVDLEGLLVPVRDLEGRVVALKIRPDRRGDGPKYLWVSSAAEGGPSPGSPPHVPLGTPAQATTARLSEGELKAEVSGRTSGLPTIGVSGVSSWRGALAPLKAMGVRIVHVAFDADARTNPGVARELIRCVEGLDGEGFEVRLELWDPRDGKGIDDLLAAGKQPEVLAGAQVTRALAGIQSSARSRISNDQAGPGDDEDGWVPDDPAEGVAPFPTDCLPGPVAQFVTEAAASFQCPVDFVAVPALAVAGAAIGASRRLRIRDGYEEGGRIYAAIIARAGSAKSPALRAACAPVYAEQIRLRELYRQAREQYEEALEAYEAARKARPKKDEPPPEVPEKPLKPAMRHVFVVDATTEALAPIMGRSPRGLLKIHDELTAWVLGMNQYKGGRGADRQFYLSCWSGEPAKVDRKSDPGEPLIVPDPYLGVVGCIPPGKLAELDAGNDGEDGFVHPIDLPDRSRPTRRILLDPGGRRCHSARTTCA